MLRLAIDKSRNNVPKGRQAEIDFGRLLEPFSGRTSFCLPLGSSKIYQVQLTHTNMLLSGIVNGTTLDNDRKYGMGARRALIHQGYPNGPIIFPLLEHGIYLRHGIDNHGSQILDVNSNILALAEQQAFIATIGGEQIANFLIVNFVIGASHQIFFG